jgi:hypothetical protein
VVILCRIYATGATGATTGATPLRSASPARSPLVAFCGQSRELKKVSINVYDLARLDSLHVTSFTTLVASLASSVERSTVRSGAVA